MLECLAIFFRFAACRGQLQFQIFDANREISFSDQAEVSSAAECAARCFENLRCTVAGYAPTPQGTAVCLFSNSSDSRPCFSEKFSTLQINGPIFISCFECVNAPASFITGTRVIQVTTPTVPVGLSAATATPAWALAEAPTGVPAGVPAWALAGAPAGLNTALKFTRSKIFSNFSKKHSQAFQHVPNKSSTRFALQQTSPNSTTKIT